VEGTCKCSKETSGTIKCGNLLTSREPVSFSRMTLLHGVSAFYLRIIWDSFVRKSSFCLNLLHPARPEFKDAMSYI
jgi:hypothetical protein